MQYLVIGNSAAAVGAVEAIRGVDRRGAITLLSHEPYLSYCRPLISYLLAGRITERAMMYRKREFYRKNAVALRLGMRANRIHTEEKFVLTEWGERFTYDRLLIACGGVPLVPPIEGGSGDGVFCFTTLDDAKAVREYIRRRNVRQVVILGGGLLGLKVTEALLERGLHITVVELADRILSATFDKQASQMMEAQMERAGVSIRLENTAGEIRRAGGRVEGVVLRDGSMVECQLVVAAIGVKPQIFPVANSEISVNKGILVDTHMQTSVPDIYAAGDVVEAYDLLLDSNRTIAIWPNAYNQGAVAGSNMAGRSREYAGGVFMNSVEICNLPSISVGITDPSDNGYEVMDGVNKKHGTYKKLVLKKNHLVGAIFIGDIGRAGIYTGLIREQLDVGGFKDSLMRSDFGLISLPAAYRKHLISGEAVES